MTRINLVPPKELTGKHLVAEYRELPRIFNLVRKKVSKKQSPKDCKIPELYKLGTGHVLFFYNKLSFLKDRQTQLIKEMQSRGYHTSFTTPDVSDIPDEWLGYYEPTPEALAINRQRIQDRL